MSNIEARWIWEGTGLRLHVKGDRRGAYYPYAYWRKSYGEVTVFPAIESGSERLVTIMTAQDTLEAYTKFKNYLKIHGYGD